MEAIEDPEAGIISEAHDEHPVRKLLVEFDGEEGTLDLLVLDCRPGDIRTVRDEIISLAFPTPIRFQNIEADTIRAQVVRNDNSTSTTGATEETIRKFEDAGWSWN